MSDFSSWLAALALLIAVLAFGRACQTARNLAVLFARLDAEQGRARQVMMQMAMTIGQARRAEQGKAE
jgi:hypothetical protein